MPVSMAKLARHVSARGPGGNEYEVWHDGWRGYAPFVYDNEHTVVHSEEFVTDEGVYIN